MAESELVLQLVYLGLVPILVFANAFFVAAEFSLVKVRRTQLAGRVAAGDKRARTATNLIDRLDEYLSACQVGITLASLGLGWVGEPAVARLLEPAFVAIGLGTGPILHATAFAVAFAFITIAHITLGEMVPKSISIQKAEATALAIARPLHIFNLVFKPFIVGLNSASLGMLRVAGFRPASDEVAHSEEELRLILSESGGTRALTQERAEMILNVFDLRKLAARNVMTPRARIVALDISRPFEEAWALAEESAYTRFPLINANLDEVVGMAHYRDLSTLARSTRPKELASVRREVLFVPEGMRVEQLLSDMISQGRHMAIVLDEFGGTAGLLTLEDIFEELFGEIRDEFDVAKSETPYRKIGDRHYLVDAQMALHEVADLLGTQLEHDDVTTLGGFVVAELGHLPGKGERIQMGPYEAVVREADRKRVKLVEVWAREETP